MLQPNPICFLLFHSYLVYFTVGDVALLSNAFIQSQYITSIHSPLSVVSVHMSSNLSSWISVDLLLIKASCLLLSRLLLFMC